MVPYSNHYAPTSWRRVLITDDKTIAFTCPHGHTFHLTDYDIAANGTVHPMVLCTEGCGFQEFITLQGWS
jgi:hypothetical protein